MTNQLVAPSTQTLFSENSFIQSHFTFNRTLEYLGNFQSSVITTLLNRNFDSVGILNKIIDRIDRTLYNYSNYLYLYRTKNKENRHAPILLMKATDESFEIPEFHLIERTLTVYMNKYKKIAVEQSAKNQITLLYDRHRIYLVSLQNIEESQRFAKRNYKVNYTVLDYIEYSPETAVFNEFLSKYFIAPITVSGCRSMEVKVLQDDGSEFMIDSMKDAANLIAEIEGEANQAPVDSKLRNSIYSRMAYKDQLYSFIANNTQVLVEWSRDNLQLIIRKRKVRKSYEPLKNKLKKQQYIEDGCIYDNTGNLLYTIDTLWYESTIEEKQQANELVVAVAQETGVATVENLAYYIEEIDSKVSTKVVLLAAYIIVNRDRFRKKLGMLNILLTIYNKCTRRKE